jgi:hypothetical protein
MSVSFELSGSGPVLYTHLKLHVALTKGERAKKAMIFGNRGV